METPELHLLRRDQKRLRTDRLARLWRQALVPLRQLLSRLVLPNSAISILGAVALPVIAGAAA